MRQEEKAIRIALFETINQVIFKLLVQGKRDSGITKGKQIQIFILMNLGVQVPVLKIN